ncbi:MAG TPA: hypothetical protein VGF92_07400 [Stellaceae bacterium]|jgi:hypothetical protein
MKKLMLAQWTKELERQVTRVKPGIAGAVKEIGTAATEIAREKIGHYQAETGPFPSWPALADSTIAEKTRLGYAPPDNPLLRSGELRDTISFYTDGFSVIVGSRDPVARWQELGTDRIPPRPLIGPAMFDVIPLARQALGKALTAVMRGEA